MLDQSLRTVKEQVLQPIADATRANIHPTTVTVFGAGVGIGAGLAAWQGMYVLGLGLWSLNRILDGLDGTLARRFNMQSDLGGYVDILLDHVVYAWIVVMMALSANTPAVWVAVGFLLMAYYVNGAGWMYLSSILEKRAQGAKTRGEFTTVTMPTGLIEGTETIIAYTLFFLLPGWIGVLFWVFAALVWLTIVQRLVWAVRHL